MHAFMQPYIHIHTYIQRLPERSQPISPGDGFSAGMKGACPLKHAFSNTNYIYQRQEGLMKHLLEMSRRQSCGNMKHNGIKRRGLARKLEIEHVATDAGSRLI